MSVKLLARLIASGNLKMYMTYNSVYYYYSIHYYTSYIFYFVSQNIHFEILDKLSIMFFMK